MANKFGRHLDGQHCRVARRAVKAFTYSLHASPGCRLFSLRCPAQTDQAAKALAGRHGMSGGTDAEALRPFCIALAPLSYELRPAWGAFFVCRMRPS